MESMGKLSDQTKPLRIGILAKFDWYLSDAQEIFKNRNHKILTFRHLNTLKQEIEFNPSFDYIFVPHFSELLPVDIYENYVCVGFHTGDLPLDRGGSPIQNKILAGEYSTNVSAFRINRRVDAGPIYTQHKIDLSKGTITELLQVLSKICAGMMLQIVENALNPIDQSANSVVKPRRKSTDSLLPNESDNLNSLYDFIRMLDGADYPRAFLPWGEFTIEFSSAVLRGEELSANCVIVKRGDFSV
jgi:methionyl-tRNA formyltransferase